MKVLTPRTTRKPILLSRLSGAFLLRMAERQFLELLFQEPPRSTRMTIAHLEFYHAVT